MAANDLNSQRMLLLLDVAWKGPIDPKNVDSDNQIIVKPSTGTYPCACLTKYRHAHLWESEGVLCNFVTLWGGG
jgi:hypothetical protein